MKYHSSVRVKKKIIYFLSTSNNSLWLSKNEALNSLLDENTLLNYYNKESVEIEAPKGNYHSIGICGISGTLIAPQSPLISKGNNQSSQK